MKFSNLFWMGIGALIATVLLSFGFWGGTTVKSVPPSKGLLEETFSSQPKRRIPVDTQIQSVQAEEASLRRESVAQASTQKPERVEKPTEVNAINPDLQFLAMDRIRTLGETVILAGTEPAEIARQALSLLQGTKPNRDQVKGGVIDGSLLYPLEGMPDGIMGGFMVREPGENGIRGYDAVVEVPYSSPNWLQGMPRRFVRVILTIGVDKDWNLRHYAVNTEAPVDGNFARSNGVEPLSVPFRRGIAYQLAIDGKIYTHELNGDGTSALNAALLIGEEFLGQDTQEQMHRLYRSWAGLLKQEVF